MSGDRKGIVDPAAGTDKTERPIWTSDTGEFRAAIDSAGRVRIERRTPPDACGGRGWIGCDSPDVEAVADLAEDFDDEVRRGKTEVVDLYRKRDLALAERNQARSWFEEAKAQRDEVRVTLREAEAALVTIRDLKPRDAAVIPGETAARIVNAAHKIATDALDVEPNAANPRSVSGQIEAVLRKHAPDVTGVLVEIRDMRFPVGVAETNERDGFEARVRALSARARVLLAGGQR